MSNFAKFDKNGKIKFILDAATPRYYRVNNIPSANVTFANESSQQTSSILYFPGQGNQSLGNMKYLGNTNQTNFTATNEAIGTNDGLTLIKENIMTPAKGMTAYITNAYNTGWLVGQCRLACLSSNVVSTISGPELITNGNFLTGFENWESSSAFPASGQVTDGQFFITATSANGRFITTINTEIGKVYTASCMGNFVSGTILSGTSIYHTTSTGTTIIGGTFALTNELIRLEVTFKATSTLSYICLLVSGEIGSVGTFDNVSVKITEEDRSTRNIPLLINGSLNKTAVASGASLVEYSGWSENNYLYQNLNAVMNFGLNDWHVCCWINTVGQGPSNLFSYSTNLSNAIWFFNGGVKTPGQIDPLGGTTACLFQGPSTGVPATSVTANSTIMTYSVCIKYGSGDATRRLLLRNNTTLTNFDEASINSETGFITGVGWTSENLNNGWFKYSYTRNSGISIGNTINLYYGNTATVNDTSSWLVAFPQVNPGTSNLYYPTAAAAKDDIATIFERSFTSGAFIKFGVTSLGYLRAIVYDGVTTRTVTSTVLVNTGKPMFTASAYLSNGSLSTYVDASNINTSSGAALLSLTNNSASTLIGKGASLNTFFPGSMALLRVAIESIPTTDQLEQIYRNELQLFRPNAKCTLDGTSNAVKVLNYDRINDVTHVGTDMARSSFKGLLRVSSEITPVGSIASISSNNGTIITCGTNVKISSPDILIEDEVSKKTSYSDPMYISYSPFEIIAITNQTVFPVPKGFTVKKISKNGVYIREFTSGVSWVRNNDGYQEYATLSSACTAGDWIVLDCLKI